MMNMKKDMYGKGGMPMVEKNGKKIPAFAADGIGKMSKGGYAKSYNKGGYAKSYNKGGYANCGASVAGTQGTK